MKRLGFEAQELNQLCELLKNEPLLRVKSIFSHLVASDDIAFDEFTNSQIALFEKNAAQIEHAVGYHALKHICNSGAITRFKNRRGKRGRGLRLLPGYARLGRQTLSHSQE